MLFRSHAMESNRVWCADFKGWFKAGDGTRVDPLTISDAWSRYLLRCQAVEKTDTGRVRAIFEAAFREHGMPQIIRTDNGPSFASLAIGGLSRLAEKASVGTHRFNWFSIVKSARLRNQTGTAVVKIRVRTMPDFGHSTSAEPQAALSAASIQTALETVADCEFVRHESLGRKGSMLRKTRRGL